MKAKLSKAERSTLLPPLEASGWRIADDRDALYKRFILKDFRAAMAFMNAMADACEEMNHHPEWLNVYSRVDVTLITHDADGITELDVTLATLMDRQAS